MSDEKPIADRMFESWNAYVLLREETSNDILRICGVADPSTGEGWPCGDITYDWYDASFELKDASPDLTFTPEQCVAFAALGFQRAWICYKDGSTERHYYYGPAVPPPAKDNP